MPSGRPAKNDAVNRAVEIVANGADPRTAWEACEKPNGESGIINIRARGRALKRKREEGQPVEPTPETPAAAAALPKRRKVYSNAKQTEQLFRRKREVDDARKEIYKEATRQVAAAKAAGTLGRSGSRYADFAAAAQALVPEGGKPITSMALKAAAARHEPGTWTQKPGPKGPLPAPIVEAAGTYVQLRQAPGGPGVWYWCPSDAHMSGATSAADAALPQP